MEILEKTKEIQWDEELIENYAGDMQIIENSSRYMKIKENSSGDMQVIKNSSRYMKIKENSYRYMQIIEIVPDLCR